MENYSINFLDLVNDYVSMLFEDNEVDKENKPSEEVIKKIAIAVGSDSELWDKIQETLNYWYEHRNIFELEDKGDK